ncbi:MAG: hypothetical protein KatS3mg019_2155 [Fimbriimonadales bacterium]|nr:MAG: hypothetical protein KatS3mg019_2155 [Fimbriimonadales bacterium]
MSTQPNYPSDPMPEKWAVIEPVLKRALYGRKRKPIGAPRRYSLYDLYRRCSWVVGLDCVGSFGWWWFCVVAASLVGGA